MNKLKQPSILVLPEWVGKVAILVFMAIFTLSLTRVTNSIDRNTAISDSVRYAIVALRLELAYTRNRVEEMRQEFISAELKHGATHSEQNAILTKLAGDVGILQERIKLITKNE